jgi:hypothetical protein
MGILGRTTASVAPIVVEPVQKKYTGVEFSAGNSRMFDCDSILIGAIAFLGEGMSEWDYNQS